MAWAFLWALGREDVSAPIKLPSTTTIFPNLFEGETMFRVKQLSILEPEVVIGVWFSPNLGFNEIKLDNGNAIHNS